MAFGLTTLLPAQGAQISVGNNVVRVRVDGMNDPPDQGGLHPQEEVTKVCAGFCNAVNVPEGVDVLENNFSELTREGISNVWSSPVVNANMGDDRLVRWCRISTPRFKEVRTVLAAVIQPGTGQE